MNKTKNIFVKFFNFNLSSGGIFLESFQQDVPCEPQGGGDVLEHGGALDLNVARRVVSSDSYGGNNYGGVAAAEDIDISYIIEVKLVLINTRRSRRELTEEIVCSRRETIVNSINSRFHNLSICSTVASDIYIKT